MSKKMFALEAEKNSSQLSDKDLNNRFFELQYSIFSKIIKGQSEEFFDKEINVMMRSNELIDSLNTFKRRQEEATIDTRSLSSIFQEKEQKSTKEQTQRKLISRKSPKINPIDFSIDNCLKQIYQNCSKRVYSDAKSIFSEVKRLKRILIQSEKRYKIKIIQRKKIIPQNHEYLKVRVGKSHVELDLFRLKNRIKELSSQRHLATEKLKNIPDHCPQEQQIKIFSEMKEFFTEKEKRLKYKEIKIQQIQKKVEKVFDTEIFKDGCEKCCTFLKKLKQSIIEYKRYLTEDNECIEQLLQKYRQQFMKYQ